MQSTSWNDSRQGTRAGLRQALALSVLALAPAPLAAQAVSITSARDVLEKWSAGKQLYVQGNVGLNAGNLARLDEALKAHPNWSVFLFSKVSGERFSSGGRSVRDYEAVEYILGTQLQNETNFGAVPFGAFLVISFEDPPYRKVGYFGGADWDRFGLGEERIWRGDVDQIAIRHLKGGRDVFGAVTGAINEIEGRRERHPGPVRAATAVKEAKDALDEYTTLSSGVKREHPQANGDLVSIDLKPLQNRLQLAEKDADFERAANEARAVGATLAGPISGLRQYGRAITEIDGVEARFVDDAKHPLAGFVTGEIEKGRTSLTTARASWERADSSYTRALEDAKRIAEGITQSLRRAVTGEGELQSVDESVTALHGHPFAAFGTAGFTVIADAQAAVRAQWNRRDLQYAAGLDALRARCLSLQQSLDTVAGDSERLELLRGRLAEAKQSRFAGKAESELREAEDALRVAGAKFADKSLEYQPPLKEASDKLEKSWSILDAASRSEAATRRFKVFGFGGMITLLLSAGFVANRRPGRTKSRERAFALLDKYERFLSEKASQVNTFPGQAEKVLDGLVSDRTTGETRTLADSATKSLQMLLPLFSEISRRVNLAREAVTPRSPSARLKSAFSSAGFERAVELLTEEVYLDPDSELAASLQSQTKGKNRAWSRPEGEISMKMDDVIDTFNRHGRTAEDVLKKLEDAYLNVGTALRSATAAEQALKSTTDTVRGELPSELSAALASSLSVPGQAAEARLAAARRLEITDPWGAVLQARATEKLLVVASRGIGVAKQLAESYGETEKVREALAAKLGVDKAKLLCEPNGDPFAGFTEAASTLNTALERFQSEESLESLETSILAAEKERAAALSLAQVLVGGADAYPNLRSELEGILEEHNQKLPEVSQSLAELVAKYGEESLKLGEGDPEHPRANGTVADNVEEVRKALRLIDQGFKKGDSLLAAGTLLALQANTTRLRGALTFIGDRLAEVDEKAMRLAEIDTDNGVRMPRLDTLLQGYEQRIDAREVTEATIQQVATARRELDDIQVALRATPRPPIDLAEKLDRIDELVGGLDNAFERDRELCAEVQRSLSAADKAVRKAGRLIEAATSDEVPDSELIADAPQELTKLTRELQKLGERADQAHVDWVAIDEEVDSVFDRATKLAARVSKEQERGAEALDAIATAAKSLKSAQKIDSRKMQRISLEAARLALNEANYALALSQAAEVRKQADRVVEAARAEAARQARIAAEARARRERERRQAEDDLISWTTSSSSSHSSHGGGSDASDIVSGVISSVFDSGSGVSSSDW